MSGLVKWGSYEVEAAEKESEEVKSESSFMKLKVGRNLVRILPPKAGRNSPFKVVRQHFIRLPGNDAPVVFSCPRNAEEGMRDRCPACEQAQKLRSTGLKVDRDKAWELMPKLRVFANVIDRNSEEDGPLVLGFGKMIFEELTALRKDEDAGGDYTHPTKGFDVIIERQGTGKMDTSYSVRIARKESPITDDSKKMAAWYESMTDLDQFGLVKSYDEILELLGVDQRGGPEVSTRRPQRKKASVIDTTADEGEDEDDDFPY